MSKEVQVQTVNLNGLPEICDFSQLNTIIHLYHSAVESQF